MKKNFDHFILTRYNYGLYDNDLIKDKGSWMRRRFELFKKCSDSVRAQKNKNFRWVISIDKNTPDSWINEISRYTDYNSIITSREIRDFMKVNIDLMCKKEWVITTRLDNDDVIDPTFVEVIQSEFREVTEVIDVKGWHSDGSYTTESVRTRPNSPFLSLVEKRSELRTCLCRPHTVMGNEFPARLLDKRLYTQVIHADCLANKMPI